MGARARIVGLRVGVAMAVFGVVVATAVVQASSATARTKPQTLTYSTKLTTLTPVPVAGQTSSASQPGDNVVITDSYSQGGKAVGTDVVHCMLVTTKESICFVAASLPKGLYGQNGPTVERSSPVVSNPERFALVNT